MIKLHGFPASNYFNMAKLALLEKDIAFEDVRIFTSQDDEMLAKSPMGKVPFLETEHGFISETNIILDYIEDALSGPALYPSAPYDRARVRELIKYTELYLELPARRCYGEAFFGSGPVSEQTKEEARAVMQKGAKALNRQATFSPFLYGDALTFADIIFLYTYPMASQVARSVFDWDLSAEIPQADDLIAALKTRKTVQKVDDDAKAGMLEFRQHYGMT